jgi:Periplasmic protein involved in polysaccharide export
MKRRSITTFSAFALFLSLALGLNSCVSTKETIYFGNLPTDSPQVKLPVYQEPVIQVDDILHVTIQTVDGGSTVALNRLSGGNESGNPAPVANGGTPNGYLVDENGQITLPMLGSFHVAGLTTSKARQQIHQAATKYFNDPTVQVRFANFKITVIGEVAKPATYTVPNEKITLLDAIGMAGDLTIYGKRQTVMLIRDTGGKKEFTRFDLTDYNTFESEYFYLKQNDVIYVEPTRSKANANNAATFQIVSLALSALSVITLAITRL